jgi:hypothetical protein
MHLLKIISIPRKAACPPTEQEQSSKLILRYITQNINQLNELSNTYKAYIDINPLYKEISPSLEEKLFPLTEKMKSVCPSTFILDDQSSTLKKFNLLLSQMDKPPFNQNKVEILKEIAQTIFDINSSLKQLIIEYERSVLPFYQKIKNANLPLLYKELDLQIDVIVEMLSSPDQVEPIKQKIAKDVGTTGKLNTYTNIFHYYSKILKEKRECEDEDSRLEEYSLALQTLATKINELNLLRETPASSPKAIRLIQQKKQEIRQQNNLTVKNKLNEIQQKLGKKRYKELITMQENLLKYKLNINTANIATKKGGPEQLSAFALGNLLGGRATAGLKNPKAIKLSANPYKNIDGDPIDSIYYQDLLLLYSLLMTDDNDSETSFQHIKRIMLEKEKDLDRQLQALAQPYIERESQVSLFKYWGSWLGDKALHVLPGYAIGENISKKVYPHSGYLEHAITGIVSSAALLSSLSFSFAPSLLFIKPTIDFSLLGSTLSIGSSFLGQTAGFIGDKLGNYLAGSSGAKYGRLIGNMIGYSVPSIGYTAYATNSIKSFDTAYTATTSCTSLITSSLVLESLQPIMATSTTKLAQQISRINIRGRHLDTKSAQTALQIATTLAMPAIQRGISYLPKLGVSKVYQHLDFRHKAPLLQTQIDSFEEQSDYSCTFSYSGSQNPARADMHISCTTPPSSEATAHGLQEYLKQQHHLSFANTTDQCPLKTEFETYIPSDVRTLEYTIPHHSFQAELETVPQTLQLISDISLTHDLNLSSLGHLETSQLLSELQRTLSQFTEQRNLILETKKTATGHIKITVYGSEVEKELGLARTSFLTDRHHAPAKTAQFIQDIESGEYNQLPRNLKNILDIYTKEGIDLTELGRLSTLSELEDKAQEIIMPHTRANNLIIETKRIVQGETKRIQISVFRSEAEKEQGFSTGTINIEPQNAPEKTAQFLRDLSAGEFSSITTPTIPTITETIRAELYEYTDSTITLKRAAHRFSLKWHPDRASELSEEEISRVATILGLDERHCKLVDRSDLGEIVMAAFSEIGLY